MVARVEVRRGSLTTVLYEDQGFVEIEPRKSWTSGAVSISLTRDAFTIQNTRHPDRFRTQDVAPEPWYFDEIRYYPDPAAPRQPQLTPFDGSRQMPDGSWLLVGAEDFKHAHHEATNPLEPHYAASLTRHMLDGGDTFFTTLCPPEDPYGTAKFATYGEDVFDRANRVLSHDPALVSLYPLASENIDLYRMDATSFDPAAKGKTFGWYMFPEHFAKAYTSWPPALLGGWYGFGDHQLPGEGGCNVHYGHAAHWFASAIRRRDPLSFAFAMMLTVKKCALGLVDSSATTQENWTVGAWRGEKSGKSRRGAIPGPTAAKEWDFDLLTALVFEPEHPILKRALNVRRTRLLNVPPATVWNGNGGGRLAGAYLRNLYDHAQFASSRGENQVGAAFVAKAVDFMAHVWRVHRAAAAVWKTKYGTDQLWFHNIAVPDKTKAWEEATLHMAMAAWQDTIVVPQADRDQLNDMIVWLCNNGSRRGDVVGPLYPYQRYGDFVQVAYEVGVAPSTASYFYASTPANLFWHVPLCALVHDRGLEHRVPAHYRGGAVSPLVGQAYQWLGRTWETTVDGPVAAGKLLVENRGEGPASHKMRAYAALSLRTYRRV